VNVAYGVREFAVYDPLLPRSYDTSWYAATGTYPDPVPVPGVPFSVFCPSVESGQLARRYGVSFVLEPSGSPGPAGTVFDATIGDETIYRVPGSALATTSASSGKGAWPATDASGTPVPVTQPDPATWKLKAAASGPSVLRLRLTDVPGWHASVDGRPLVLEHFGGVMLQARLASGRHTVELQYWPETFTIGIACAGAAVLGILFIIVIAGVRRRTRLAESSPRGHHGRPPR
jgi:hypothetical protein